MAAVKWLFLMRRRGVAVAVRVKKTIFYQMYLLILLYHVQTSVIKEQFVVN